MAGSGNSKQARELAKLRRIAGQTLAALLITKDDAFDRLRGQREMLAGLDDAQLLKLRQLLEGLVDAIDDGAPEQWARIEQAWQQLGAKPAGDETTQQDEPAQRDEPAQQDEQTQQDETTQQDEPETTHPGEPEGTGQAAKPAEAAKPAPTAQNAASPQPAQPSQPPAPKGLFDEETRTGIAEELLLDHDKTLSEAEQLNEDETTTNADASAEPAAAEAAAAQPAGRLPEPDATGSLPNFPYPLTDLPPLNGQVETPNADEQTQALGLDENGLYRPRPEAPPPSEVTMTFRQAGVGNYGKYDDDATSTLGFTSEAHPLALSVDEYAALCAERDNRPNRRRVIEMRYEINTEACREAVDRFFELRFGQDPSMRSDWQQAYFRYTAMLKRIARR